MISRIKYRKQVNNFMTGKRPVVSKHEKLKLEHAHADNLEESKRNRDFGFQCLHYSVSESTGLLKVNILKKDGGQCDKVRVATVDGDAKDGDDYIGVDTILDFSKNNT